MSRVLSLRNRQRLRTVDTRLFRRIIAWTLTHLFHAPSYELGVHLVDSAEMSVVNKTFLGHSGSTDVITFDHAQSAVTDGQRMGGRPLSPSLSPARSGGEGARRAGEGAPSSVTGRKARTRSGGICAAIHGEIFISVEDAEAHAHQFHVAFQEEIVRYLIHGLLHLHGFDDHTPAARARMKREENRLLRAVGRQYTLRRLLRRTA